MKKNILIFLIFSFISFNIFAETWICTVDTYDEKKANFIYLRKDDGNFYWIVEDYEIPVIKTFENNKYLHLVFSDGNMLGAQVINKVTRKIESVLIEESELKTVDKVYGACKVR